MVRQGYTLRNTDWRYTAWFRWQNATLTSDFAGPYAAELYAHTGDHSYEMDKYENEVRGPLCYGAQQVAVNRYPYAVARSSLARDGARHWQHSAK